MNRPGAQLKKIRLEKGISLEEVQKKTRIHLNILKAMEGDSLTNLNPIYLKGFLKIYCNFLGVDPKGYALEVKESKDTVKAQPPVKPAAVKKEGEVLNKGIPFFQALLRKGVELKKHAPVIKKGIVLVIVSVLSLFILINVSKIISSRHKAYVARKKARVSQSSRTRVRTAAEKTVSKPVQKAAPSSVPAVVAGAGKQVSVAAVETGVPVSKETGTGIRLGVRARENCWMFVKVDGKVVFQRTLEKGRFESWLGKERIELSVSNAASVELEVNGQLFSNLGRRGQVLKNILITKEGLNIPR